MKSVLIFLITFYCATGILAISFLVLYTDRIESDPENAPPDANSIRVQH